MQHHQEKPDLRLDQALCTLGALGLLGVAARLLVAISQEMENTPPWRFFALAGAVVLALYMGWLAFAYARIRYSVHGEVLKIQTALRTLEIPLSDVMNLYRWRQRWLWHGSAASELGVEYVLLLPNTLLKARGLWVLVYRTPDGDRQAVGIMPSAHLLATLKALAWERKGAAG